MIIYNITTLVSWPIHDEWREWMTAEFLPQMLSTNLFTHYQLVRLMEVNEDDGPTYAVQLYLKNATDFDLYREKYLRIFQQREKLLWGDDATSFASLMQVIN